MMESVRTLPKSFFTSETFNSSKNSNSPILGTRDVGRRRMYEGHDSGIPVDRGILEKGVPGLYPLLENSEKNRF